MFKWILIVVFVAEPLHGGKGFSFQEFDSKGTCEAAKQKVVEMTERLRAGAGASSAVQIECVQK